MDRKFVLITVVAAVIAIGLVVLIFDRSYSLRDYVFPVVVVTGLVFPIVWVVILDSESRELRRRRRGAHCLACGYDLKGLGKAIARCPECGALIE